MPEWSADVGAQVPALFIAVVAICVVVAALVAVVLLFVRHLREGSKTMVSMSDRCHATSEAGHQVLGKLERRMGEALVSQRETREVLRGLERASTEQTTTVRELGTYVRTLNGKRSGDGRA